MTTIRQKAIGVAIEAAFVPASPFSAPIEKIMVTAQNREELLQGEPIAITAFTSETLADIGALGFSTNSFGDPRTWGVDLRYEF